LFPKKNLTINSWNIEFEPVEQTTRTGADKVKFIINETGESA